MDKEDTIGRFLTIQSDATLAIHPTPSAGKPPRKKTAENVDTM